MDKKKVESDLMVNEPSTSNHSSNTNELAGSSNGEPITLYSKITEYFKQSNINDRKFCKNLNIVRSTLHKFLKNKIDRVMLKMCL